jgi:uncharacterized repeat protein (TIGR01451 family)
LIQAAEPEDPPPPIVAIRVRVPSTGSVGAELEYQILIENRSPAAAHHVLIKNPLPRDAQFVRALPEPTRKKPELQWELGTLRGGEHRRILLILKPSSGADVKNCTRVQFEHGECVTTHLAGFVAPPPTPVSPPEVPPRGVVPPPGPKAPTGKEPPVGPLPQPGKAKLSLEMTGPAQQLVNIPAQYLITVRNTGPASATNVLIADKLPAGLIFVSAGQNGQFAEGQVAWTLGTLDPGQSKTVELVLRASQIGEICHKARVDADLGQKAEASLCTLFKGARALLLEMFDRKDPIPVGGDTSYPIMVLNQGQLPVTNIRIKAFIPDAMVLSNAQGPTGHQVGQKTGDGYQIIIFDPVINLEPGARLDFEVFVRAVKPGDVRFKVEMAADYQTAGPVREEESTTIFSENGHAPRRTTLETSTGKQRTKNEERKMKK